MARFLDVGSSFLVSVARGGAGMSVGKLGKRPEKLLELYEFEACPFCRKTREMLTYLDLEAMVFPSPKNGTRFRPKAIALGGKKQFPYLVDPNTNTSLYESDDINRYLADTYGTGTVPLSLSLGPMTALSSSIASMARATAGVRVEPSKEPAKPLELWSFEASPYCRLVRETLCSLEVPYHLHNVGKGSPSRDAFVAKSGKMMVPYLVDENTGAVMFESSDIVRYLEKTYGTSNLGGF